MADDVIRIILVDDDADDRELFKKAILDMDLEIDLKTFENGFQLIDYIESNHGYNPTIIFLDLNMPQMSGMECLKKIRGEQVNKDISIAIYSTSSSENDIDDTFINGANIYINKPHSFKDLKNVIKKVLKINWQYYNSSLNRETFLLRL